MARKRHLYSQARALKQGRIGAPEGTSSEPCAECDAPPDGPHASWCLADEVDDDDEG